MPEIGFLRTNGRSANEQALRHFIDYSYTFDSDALKYSVSRRLAGLYPDKAIIQSTLRATRIREFSQAGHCDLTITPDVHAEEAYDWDGFDDGYVPVILNAFYDIRWNGHELRLLTLTIHSESDPSPNTWVISDSTATATDFINTVQRWHLGLREEILVFDDFHAYRDRVLTKSVREASFDDIVLPAGMKERMIEDFEQFFASRELYESHNIPWKRGAILIGPPGNGKTHTIKALLNRLNKPTIYVKRVETEGPGSSAIPSIFIRARTNAPCIIVLEDLDSLIGKSNRSLFLNEMDGMSSNNGIMVLATTNHPELIDPAILNRPSRFDRKYTFGLPAEDERLAFLTLWNEARFPAAMRLTPEQLAQLAARTNGYSFAYLKELAVSMMTRWFHAQDIPVWSVATEQCDLLNEQVKTPDDEPPQPKPQRRGRRAPAVEA